MRRGVRLVLVAGALAAALVGCGDGDGDEPTAEPGDPVTVTETVAEPSDDVPTATATVSQPTDKPVVPSETSDTGGPPGGVTEPPRSYDEAIEHFSAAFALNDIPQELSRFETPTGNIYCVLDDAGIPPSCEIAEGGVRDDAQCIEAPSPVVGRIEFTERGPVPVCNSDTIRTPGPPILGYTGVAAFTGLSIQCLSEEIGVTCLNTGTKQGFFLARGRYQLFT